MVVMSEIQSPSGTSVLRDHAALVVSAALAVFTLLRLVAVAGGDATTAYAILRYVGTANVIAASVVILVPFGVVWAIVAGIVRARNQRDLRTYGPLIAIMALIAFRVASPGVMVVAGVTGLLAIPSLVALQRDARSVRRAMIFFIVMLAAATLVSSAVWLPTEVIETQGRVYVGYVLEEDTSASLVLLEYADRQVTRVASDAIESRRFCEIRRSGANWFNRALDTPLFALISNGADYPECPVRASRSKHK